jgi:hypothetical protein
MNKTTDLRRTANLCKRVAEIRTSGGHRTDRRLLTLAERLDYEAARLEGQTEPRQAAYDDLKN